MRKFSLVLYSFVSLIFASTTLPLQTSRITVYFIRHANSIWNDATDVFGELGKKSLSKTGGALKQLKNLATGAVKTVVGYAKKTFRDAELSEQGIKQARALANWLETQCPANPDLMLLGGREWNHDACVLNRPNEDVTLLASNLKRTHQTLIIGLSNRLHQGLLVPTRNADDGVPADHYRQYETIHVLGDLQEIGCKTDARPREEKLILLPRPDQCSCWFNTRTIGRDPLFRQRPIQATNPQEEHNEMMDTCVEKRDENLRFSSIIESLFLMHKLHEKSVFVIVGHSHWIQHFVRQKLIGGDVESEPGRVGASWKAEKIPNTAVIKFDLIANKDAEGNIDTNSARIDPESPAWIFKPDIEDYVPGEDVEEEDLDEEEHVSEGEPLVL